MIKSTEVSDLNHLAMGGGGGGVGGGGQGGRDNENFLHAAFP